MRHHRIRQPMYRHGRSLAQMEWTLLTLPFTWPFHLERALVNRRRRAKAAHHKARQQHYAQRAQAAPQGSASARQHAPAAPQSPPSVAHVLVNAWKHGYEAGAQAGHARLVERYPELLSESSAPEDRLDQRVRRWLYQHGLPGVKPQPMRAAPAPSAAQPPAAQPPLTPDPESMLTGPKTYKRPNNSTRERNAAYGDGPDASTSATARPTPHEPPPEFLRMLADLRDTLVELKIARSAKDATELLHRLPAGVLTPDMNITEAIRAVRAHLPNLL